MYLAKHFPREFPAAILVTIHLPSQAQSQLDILLSRAGALPAHFAADGDVICKGTSTLRRRIVTCFWKASAFDSAPVHAKTIRGLQSIR